MFSSDTYWRCASPIFCKFDKYFLIFRGVELRHIFPSEMLRGYLVCVICNSNSFHSFIFKLCTHWRCAPTFLFTFDNILFLGVLNLDIINSRPSLGLHCVICNSNRYYSFYSNCAYLLYIEGVHLLFCAFLIDIFSYFLDVELRHVIIFFEFSLTVKAAPHECVIRTVGKAENEVWFYSIVTLSSCPLPQYRRKTHYLVLKTQQNNCIWKCLFNIGIETKIVDPDRTTGAVWSGSTLFIYEASDILVGDKIYILWLCALRVHKCEFSVYRVRIFMKCRHVCAAQTAYLFFTKLYK